MQKPYVETDCTIRHEGRAYTAGGAVVTEDRIAAYLAPDGVLTDWHGQPLGTWREVARWRTPRSYVSSYMLQVEARVDGVLYTGRSAGVQMLYRGKRKGGSK